jgi:hypothetical protein
MNVSEFTYLLQQPEKITLEQVKELQQVLVEYPFFQAPKAVYLKGLKNLDSFKYNNTLKHTAAYTTDRSILFDFITSKTFEQHQIAKTINGKSNYIKEILVKAEEVSPPKPIAKIEEASPFSQEETNEILDPQLFTPKDPRMADFLENRKEAEKQLELGKPLSFNKAELHSFSEWLKLASYKPIDRDEEANASTIDNAKKSKFDLIDKFIESNPKIVPTKSTLKGNLAKQAKVSKNELMTETLARVYLEQNKFNKAIKAYEILSLKYPEKSGFFADQIRAIKKLQQNNS